MKLNPGPFELAMEVDSRLHVGQIQPIKLPLGSVWSPPESIRSWKLTWLSAIIATNLSGLAARCRSFDINPAVDSQSERTLAMNRTPLDVVIHSGGRGPGSNSRIDTADSSGSDMLGDDCELGSPRSLASDQSL